MYYNIISPLPHPAKGASMASQKAVRQSCAWEAEHAYSELRMYVKASEGNLSQPSL